MTSYDVQSSIIAIHKVKKGDYVGYNKGWVTALLFVSKLQALPKKGMLAKALQEYGKIAKTISALCYR